MPHRHDSHPEAQGPKPQGVVWLRATMPHVRWRSDLGEWHCAYCQRPLWGKYYNNPLGSAYMQFHLDTWRHLDQCQSFIDVMTVKGALGLKGMHDVAAEFLSESLNRRVSAAIRRPPESSDDEA